MTTPPAASSASEYRFLLLIIPSVFIFLLATGLFERSGNITADSFQNFTSRLTHSGQDSPASHSDTIHFLIEVKARYVWLTTVVVSLVAGVYALVLCATIIYQTNPRGRIVVVGVVGTVMSAIGLIFIAFLDNHHALYRAVYSFTYEALRHAGPHRITQELLQYVRTVVSVVNAQAIIVPIVALLAACSTLTPPVTGSHPDPDYCALQMRRLKDVLSAASAILVAGILHMGAWLRWPSALVGEPHAHEAVLGAALAITLFWGVTFTLMLVATYLPAAILLARRAQALLQERPDTPTVPDRDQWLKDHGLFLSLQDHFPQFGLMLAPLLASPLSSLLLAPLNPTG